MSPLRPMCVYLCVQWHLKFFFFLHELRKLSMKQDSWDQSASLMSVQHKDKITHTRGMKPSDISEMALMGNEIVRQLGKCHWGACSLLLIKKHTIKIERERDERKRQWKLYWFSFLCKITGVLFYIYNIANVSSSFKGHTHFRTSWWVKCYNNW